MLELVINKVTNAVEVQEPLGGLTVATPGPQGPPGVGGGGSTAWADITGKPLIVYASTLGLSLGQSLAIQDANVRAIQGALDAINAAGGGTLYFDKPGTYTVGPELCNTPGTNNYRVNASLVVYSNTTIEGVNNVRLRRANNSNCYFLRNNLAGDSTLRDSDITIRNINFDFNHTDGQGANSTAQGPSPRGNAFWWLDGNWFDRVDGLTIIGGTYTRASKYLVWITNCTDGYYVRLRLKNTNSDGLHFGAGCFRHRTDSIIGTCKDNLIPIIASEGAYRSEVSNQYCQAPVGNASDFEFRNTVLVDCFEAFRFAGETGNTIKNVLIDGVTGTSSTPTWWSVADDNADIGNGTLAGIIGGTHTGITIRNARVVCPAGNFTGGISATNCKDITLDNVHTAPDNDLLIVYPAVAGMNFIKIVNCSAERAWRGWVTLNGTIGHFSEVGSIVNLGSDGRFLQLESCTVKSVCASAGIVDFAAGASHSSDYLIRTATDSVVTEGVSCSKNVNGISGLLDVQHTTEIAVSFSGFVWGGYTGGGTHIIYQRNGASKTHIGGAGVVYKNFATMFNDRGIVGAPSGAGYVRVNNASLRIRGREIIAGTPPAASVIDGDRFFNTDTTSSAPFNTAAAYGEFVYRNGAWVPDWIDSQPRDAELTAIAALSTNGLVARTSASTAAARTISSGTNITVTNGDGVAGNPTVAFSGTLATDNGGTGKANAGWASTPAAGTVLFLSRASTSAIDSLASFSLVTATSTFTMAGAFVIAPPVVAGATPPAAERVTAAAHTNGTTGVEYSDVVWNLAAVYQRATGAVATQRTIVISPRTYSFVGASTITKASTLAISGPPIAGTNATLTRTWTLDVESGNARFAGQVVLDTIGSGVQVREGVNAMQGVATLVAGTVTVSHNTIAANSRIILTGQDNLVTGALRVSARTVNTSFTITSSNAGDTGVVAYEIFTPAP